MNKWLNSFAAHPFGGFVHTGVANGLYTRFLVAAATAAKTSSVGVMDRLALTAEHLVSVNTHAWQSAYQINARGLNGNSPYRPVALPADVVARAVQTGGHGLHGR